MDMQQMSVRVGCGSDIIENVAMADVLRGEMVRRFMMRSLEEEHIRRWKGVERIV